MSESKHTPGPWKDTMFGDSGFSVTSADLDGEWSGHHVVCSVVRPNHGPDVRHEDAANARLIAAAPGLLEACKRLLDYVGSAVYEDEFTESGLEDMNFAREQIARAEGRE